MTLTTELQSYDDRLDNQLRRQVGICLGTYKALRFLFRAVAIGTIVLTAIHPQASLPPVGYITLGAVALGPDVAEAYLTRGG